MNERIVRRARGLAWLSVTVAGAAGCNADFFGTDDVYSLEMTPPSGSLVRGETMQLAVVARDAGGRIVHPRIEWASANEHIVSVSSGGLATAVATGGPVEVTATADGERAFAMITVRTTDPVSRPVAAMLERISTIILSELRHLEQLLPLNPRRQDDIRARIALLQRPTLASEVIDGRYFAEDSAQSTDGRTVSIVSVYPLASLAGEAVEATGRLAQAIPILEGFVRVSIPAAGVQVWQGFSLGGRGGSGTILIEDRATYERGTPVPAVPFVLPWLAMLVHELAHSFVGNEGLTQFLELYTYNLMATGSTDSRNWTFTRGHVPMQDTNSGVHALLDIYMLMGEEAMSRAFADVHPFRPRYGEPLPTAAQQAFVAAAPPELRGAVAAKISHVTF